MTILMAKFSYECNRKVKKLAYLVGYCLALAQIWCRGKFLDYKSKINNKIFIRQGKIPIYRSKKMHMIKGKQSYVGGGSSSG